MDISEKFDSKEIEDAQNKLEKLCNQNGIQPFMIKYTGSDSKKWKALVLRMCGLEVPDPIRGRTPDKDLKMAGGMAYLYFDLCGYKPKDMADEIIKRCNLKPNKHGHFKESDLREALRTARKKCKKEIEKLASEASRNEENPDTLNLLTELEKMME
ncbi:MAG: hypothetical protein MRY79_05520 [Alphaproteobacteria bacterium]|nr:hypothetical protein [Alphaproteobacteria bacterium]